MAAVSQPAHDRPAPWLRIGLVVVIAVVAVVAIVVFVDVAARNDDDSTRGSGVAATEYRELPPFATVEPGTGTLEVSGTVDRLTAVLSASGRVELRGLVAHDAIARLEGTGEIDVHATSTLDATLTGTGSIVYSGSPFVTTHNAGTGSITGE